MKIPDTPENEVQRLAALDAMDVLFTPGEERFDRITRLALQVLGTPIALVSLVSEKSQWFKSAQGLDVPETPREISFCGHAILSDETFVVEDAAQDERFFDNPLVTGGPNVRSYAGHPLHSIDGDRIGTLCIIDRSPRKFTSEQLQALQDLAAIAETELQRGQLNDAQRELIQEMDELKRKASIDGLTRLWNRAAVLELMSAELKRAKRGLSMCIAMIDIDNLKKVNEQHGNDAGDRVLVEVAARIRRVLREYDTVGRWGGEEFVAVLSNAALITSMKLCQRIRVSIEKTPISTPAGPVSITVSIGLVPIVSKKPDLERLIGESEAAVSRAKKNGRNRVETGNLDGAA
ncbi:MAG: sensor domain-containing diguanylate cyclase [Burkholderiaceae bacterium]|nr:sensor domain-containing diguanylate cyclase [Sulfuritalea sp.]MCF8175046.1 sensor domain-containing diguanylate cyclase [Burkholderiaceae bacterium]